MRTSYSHTARFLFSYSSAVYKLTGRLADKVDYYLISNSMSKIEFLIIKKLKCESVSELSYIFGAIEITTDETPSINAESLKQNLKELISDNLFSKESKAKSRVPFFLFPFFHHRSCR